MSPQFTYIVVAIILPFIFVLLCCLTVYATSRNRSWHFKLSLWGAFSIVLISPVLSVVISQIALIITNDGWTGIGILMLSFEVLEAISVLLFVTGIVGSIWIWYKNKPEKAKPQNLDS
ncbi:MULTISPECIES: hypothetical protein [unclassified Lysinibacillus]|uniref:hypothetical protein n=1 Tax=unclassified Lysinibacillus TaxID=2636778 RepID=UPI00382307B9